MQAIVSRHKALEREAIEAAYGTFVAAMPESTQQNLAWVESFYETNKDSIAELQTLMAEVQLLSTLAGAYYNKGAIGVFEAAFLFSCNRLMQGATDLASAAITTQFGTGGYYTTKAAGHVLRTEICGRFMPALFQEGTGESWLTGVVVFSGDPLVNEWIQILYSGDVMAGLDRPDLPLGIDFFFRERVNNPEQILRKFPSQPELHEALEAHWVFLNERFADHPELGPMLDITGNEMAQRVWKEIYQVAGETLVQAIRKDQREKKKPEVVPTTIARLAAGELSWPPSGDERPRPRVVSGATEALGELAAGTRHSVTANLGVLGLSGLDEVLDFNWTIEGPGLDDAAEDRRRVLVRFPDDLGHPLNDLIKVARSEFAFIADPEIFEAGETYEVVATVTGTNDEFRFPFSMDGGLPDTDRPSDDGDLVPDDGGDAVASLGDPEPDEAHFVISVEGHGFRPSFDQSAKPRFTDPDGTVWIGQSGAYVGHEVDGRSEVWMTLEAGEDHDAGKESFRRYLLSRACRGDGAWDNPAASAGLRSHSAPTVWQNGPKIVTIAGPFADRSELGRDLDNAWSVVRETREDGSHVLMDDLVKKIQPLTDCGGNCCQVQCTDPFHCG